MVFNVCICTDLVLMIKHPFASKQKRIIRYYIYSYSFGILAALETLYYSDRGTFLGFFQTLSFIVFMIMGAFSSIFAFSRLCKPGVSIEVRQLILKRHVAFILFFFICNIYLLIQEF
jgi:hypothetical protein